MSPGNDQEYMSDGIAEEILNLLAKVQGIRPQSMVYDGYIRQLKDDPRWKPWVDSLDWSWEYESVVSAGLGYRTGLFQGSCSVLQSINRRCSFGL